MLIDHILSSSTQPLLEKTAAFAERRHDVLAGNLANVSTPGYQARDLPVEKFQAALRQAIEAKRVSPEMLAGGAAGSESADSPGLWAWNASRTEETENPFPRELFAPVKPSPTSVAYQDGATRSIESEIMELTKNSLLQTTAIELMTSQFNKLQAVISERA